MSETTYRQVVVQGNSIKSECQYEANDPIFMLVGTNETGQSVFIPVDENMLSRHLLLLGGIGTGKTNAFCFLIRNIRASMTDRDVMIIFDTKGDYYQKFYRPGDVVISNDDRATGGNGADYWNLFGEITIDSRIEENILEISKTLFADKIKHSNQPFFPIAAKDLFSAVLLHLSRAEQFSELRHNRALRNIFNSFSVADMKSILNLYPDLKGMCSYIMDERSGQTLGVVAELQQLVREIFIGNFQKKGNLSIRQLIRKKQGRVIFIEYDLGIGNMLTPIYKLLFDLGIKEALCRTENEGNVYFIIDEFRMIPNLQHVDDGINFGRSLGAKFIIGVQNVDHIAASYGQDLANSILSGLSTTISFRVGDRTTREYIKGLYGRNIKLQTYLSAIQSRGLSEETREGNVVEDEDISNLRGGEAIVGILNTQPFMFRFNEFK